MEEITLEMKLGLARLDAQAWKRHAEFSSRWNVGLFLACVVLAAAHIIR
jgi:hypothetical protein